MRTFLLVSLLFFLFVQPGYTQVGIFIRPNSSSLPSPVTGQTWFFNSTNNTLNAYNGASFFAVSAPKNNFTASIAPTTANDNTQGYSPGSAWYNTSTGFTYQLVDATTSAALWIQTNNLGSLSIPLTSLQSDGAASGQSILFNGTNWVPGSPLISLNNVLQTGALTGQVPLWNGTNWVPTSLAAVSGAPAALTYLTVADETANLPDSSRLVAGTNITLTSGTNTLTIAAPITGLPNPASSSASGSPPNLLFYNGANFAYIPDTGTNDGSLLSLRSNVLTWSPGCSTNGSYAMPFTTDQGAHISWTAGLIGSANNANSPRTGSTYTVGYTASLNTINPDSTSGTIVTLPLVGNLNSGAVIAVKNIGATSNLTVNTSSGQAFDNPSGLTTKTVLPGQCLLIMAQPSTSAQNTWVILSLN